MKKSFAARVVGHELVAAKNSKASSEQMKVKVAMKPISGGGRTTTGLLTMTPEDAVADFPLRRTLMVTIEESQHELFETPRAEAPAKDPAQLEIDDAVTAPPRRRGRPPKLGVVNRKRSGAEKSESAH
jgi:hypothetical protein